MIESLIDIIERMYSNSCLRGMKDIYECIINRDEDGNKKYIYGTGGSGEVGYIEDENSSEKSYNFDELRMQYVFDLLSLDLEYKKKVKELAEQEKKILIEGLLESDRVLCLKDENKYLKKQRMRILTGLNVEDIDLPPEISASSYPALFTALVSRSEKKMECNDMDGAIKVNEAIVKLFEKEGKDSCAMRRLAYAHGYLGKLYKNIDNKKAVFHKEKEIELFESIDIDENQKNMHIAYAHSYIGCMLKETDEEKAIFHMEKTLEAIEKVDDLYEGKRKKANIIGNSWNILGGMHRKKNLKKTIECYENTLKAFETLNEFKLKEDDLFIISHAHSSLRELHRKTDTEAAIFHGEKAIETFKKMDIEEEERNRFMAHEHSYLGMFYHAKKPEKAIFHRKTAKRLLKRSDMEENERNIGIAYECDFLGTLLRKQDAQKAIKYKKKAIEIFEKANMDEISKKTVLFENMLSLSSLMHKNYEDKGKPESFPISPCQRKISHDFSMPSKLQGNFVGSNSVEKMQVLEGNNVDNHEYLKKSEEIMWGLFENRSLRDVNSLEFALHKLSNKDFGKEEIKKYLEKQLAVCEYIKKDEGRLAAFGHDIDRSIEKIHKKLEEFIQE